MACKEQMTAILLPPPLLRMVLKNKFTWRLVLDYLKHFNKFNSSFLRIKFLRIYNDNIPDFLRFRVPDNGVFSDQAVHSFQLRLLRSELSQANADRAKASGNLVKALPLWVREVLSFGPKHPVRDKFNEIHFLADIDSFLSELKLIPGEKLCEIEAAAKRYGKNVKQTPSDKDVEKARNYLKDNGLLAVPIDKGVGFV